MRLITLLIVLLISDATSYAQNATNSSGGNASGSGSASFSIGQLLTSTYSNSNGTITQGVQLAFEQIVLGNHNMTINQKAIVYPNPTLGDTTLKVEHITGRNLSYQLFNSLGSIMSSEEISVERTTIPTANLSAGVYYLQIRQNHKKTKIFKIIKQ